jgi:hypothetical protein
MRFTSLSKHLFLKTPPSIPFILRHLSFRNSACFFQPQGLKACMLVNMQSSLGLELLWQLLRSVVKRGSRGIVQH